MKLNVLRGAKLITNGLVIEGRHKKQIKDHIDELRTNAKMNLSKYPTRKKRADSGTTWGERRNSEMKNEDLYTYSYSYSRIL